MLPHPPGEVLGDEDAGAAQQLRLPQHSLLVLNMLIINTRWLDYKNANIKLKLWLVCNYLHKI